MFVVYIMVSILGRESNYEINLLIFFKVNILGYEQFFIRVDFLKFFWFFIMVIVIIKYMNFGGCIEMIVK